MVPSCRWFTKIQQVISNYRINIYTESTLPETNTALENWSLEVEDCFPCRMASFQLLCSFQGGCYVTSSSILKSLESSSCSSHDVHPRLLVRKCKERIPSFKCPSCAGEDPGEESGGLGGRALAAPAPTRIQRHELAPSWCRWIR